jgi:hypothetical protein
MKSFQQKVPPILLGAFEDIFDWKVEETTGSVGFHFSSTGEGSVLRHRLTINVTRFNTHVHKHGWRNFVREIDLFQEWRHILTSFYRSEEEPRHSSSLRGNIDRISIINTKNPPQSILWDFLWGTVRSTVSRIYRKRLLLLLM